MITFPDSSVGKESTCYAGDRSLIPGLGRSPGEEIGYPLQYSGLENPMDCIVHWSQRVGHDWATFTLIAILKAENNWDIFLNIFDLDVTLPKLF